MENDKLTEYRKQIDEIDRKIVELLGKRMSVVKKVGEYKKEQHIPSLAQSRWEAVLQSKMELAEQVGIDSEMVKDIYNRIHAAALDLEESL